MKKILSLILVLFVLGNAFVVFAENADAAAQTFTQSDQYKTTSPLKSAPKTFEAWLEVEKNAPSSRLGVIFGNYGGADEFSSVTFEIRNNGNPYIWWNSQRVEFNNIDLRTGEKLHLAITVTDADARCYINGELKQTIHMSLAELPASTMNHFIVGGDLRAGNEQYLKNTKLYAMAAYSESRTADQIKSDLNGINDKESTLLCAYDMTVAGKDRLLDRSAEGNHLTYTGSSADADASGFAFSATDAYRMESLTDELPVTFEAMVYFPETMASTERGGVILGNYGDAVRCISFEIYSGGAPRIYWVGQSGNVRDFVFRNINVYTGEWTHIAIVRDNTTLSCYINGELKQSLSCGVLSQEPCPKPFAVGGDLRSGNGQYFKGRIKSVAIYSDARTESEIKSDMSSLGKDGLIAAYDFSALSSGEAPDVFADLSENGNDLKRYSAWLDSVPERKDYAYSFAVVGDTQVVAEYYPDEFTHIYDWIVANAREKKIKFVFGLGDITNSDTDAEWSLVTKHIAKLDNVVPYSLCRGNHDSSLKFRKAFLNGKFGELIEGRYEDTLENTWQELIIGETKYLIMTLDYGASDEVLNWAGGVISAHPDHSVIITTHSYLFRDGTTLDQKDVCPPATTGGFNNGDHMWDKLISKYENIKLVLSGHDPCDKVVVTQTKGVHGNTITQMLIDPQGVDSAQGPTGLVAMLYFSEDGKNVSVEYYSTVREKYFMEENQFRINLELAINNVETSSTVISTPETESSSVIDSNGEADPNTGKLIAIISVSVLLVAAVVVTLVVAQKRKNK